MRGYGYGLLHCMRYRAVDGLTDDKVYMVWQSLAIRYFVDFFSSSVVFPAPCTARFLALVGYSNGDIHLGHGIQGHVMAAGWRDASLKRGSSALWWMRVCFL